MEKIKAYGICLYKVDADSVKILLCKSVKSNEKWGFLKGVAISNETAVNTALREFEEECNINVKESDLEKFYLQENELKDIGIYLVNAKKVKNLEQYFMNDILLKVNLSLENSEVQFFDINSLPPIKKKQSFLTSDIVKFLK